MQTERSIRFAGTRRGVFGLTSWAPLPKPGERVQTTVPAEANNVVMRNNVSVAGDSGHFTAQFNQLNTSLQPNLVQSVATQNMSAAQPAVANGSKTSTSSQNGARQAPVAPPNGTRLMAKFNYEAKANSPLGPQAELSLRMLDKMTLLGPHKQQEFWWLVRLDSGEEGYVPANYLTKLEEKVTGLPWLANRPVEPAMPTVASGASYKPYKSAYSANATETDSAASQWFCDICQKSFNGPQPYNAHMSSRAHKDEVEAQTR